MELLGFFGWFFLLVLTCVLAGNKGRSVFGWLLLSLFFGPLALIAVLCLPKQTDTLDAKSINTGMSRRCPYCAEVVLAAAVVCKHCGRDLPAAEATKPAADNFERTIED